MKIKNIKEAIAKAYNLSQPQGMGYLHFQPGVMPEDAAKVMAEEAEKKGEIYFDYLAGRAMKIGFKRYEDGWQCNIADGHWFDHSASAVEEFRKECERTDG